MDISTISVASSKFINLFIGLLGFAFVIGFHELGHFLFAKLFGVGVPHFSIGFGPRLISKKLGNTTVSLSAIPLGGYVQIADSIDQIPGMKKSDLFSSKPYYQKLAIMLGGIGFNLIFAYVAIITIFSVGAPGNGLIPFASSQPIVNQAADKNPAKLAGIKSGDHITKVNNQPTPNVQELIDQLHKHPSETVQLQLIRDGKTLTIPVTTDKAAHIGISFSAPPIAPHPIKEAITKGIAATNGLIKQSAKMPATLFKSRSLKGVGGPVMIISKTAQGAGLGWRILLILLAFLSIQLALLNLIPLPILDGGQILFLTIEAIIRRPLKYSIKVFIHYLSWGLMMLLFLALTIKDIWALVQSLPIIRSLFG
ncbi:PDZ domain-containing protein [bacterium]|jgi:regulator of sigma E protease|nr:PDZ domain-containing protein [bacterium]MBT3903525.1 PDZ domain-containing protein [bacterium]MBT5346121.1 PDZ domain-containing protein [bacterium]MBT6131390.1 PDZ domain-containing protein [bacterium]MBT6529239.1 PDZ domain-containing protein [bacterium]